MNLYATIDDGGVAPQFWRATSDVRAADKGDTITVKSVAYTVVSVHPEGTGVMTLISERA